MARTPVLRVIKDVKHLDYITDTLMAQYSRTKRVGLNLQYSASLRNANW